jgi:hypothetical protein
VGEYAASSAGSRLWRGQTDDIMVRQRGASGGQIRFVLERVSCRVSVPLPQSVADVKVGF